MLLSDHQELFSTIPKINSRYCFKMFFILKKILKTIVAYWKYLVSKGDFFKSQKYVVIIKIAFFSFLSKQKKQMLNK